MLTGDFPAAWHVSDQVLQNTAAAGAIADDPALPYHRRFVWDGRQFDGQAVLVRCYHGLGDTLQFCRYLPLLRSRVDALTLETQPDLIPLLTRLAGPDRILPFDPAAPLPPSACDLEIMELAHALRAPPSPEPYFRFARPGHGAGVRAGLCWQVNTGWRPERSLDADAIAPLLEIGGVRLHSLQKGAALPGTAPCPDAILDTARLIAGLDLVITVDTMVAHLAGAIGVPVWLLLDAAPDWRWWAGGRGSVWYGSIRKYQQTTSGDWTAPLAAVAADLTRLIAAGTVRTR